MWAPLNQHIEMVSGDDYKAADGRALSWTFGPTAPIPSNLAGATLSFVIGHTQYNLYGNLPITFTGTVPATPPNPQTITLDVAGSNPTTGTTNLPAGEYQYQLTATLTNLDVITIAVGNLTILAAPNTVPLYPPAV